MYEPLRGCFLDGWCPQAELACVTVSADDVRLEWSVQLTIDNRWTDENIAMQRLREGF